MGNRIKVLDDDGIIEEHSNNGKSQTVLIEYGENLYRIKVHVESYDFQSYAKLWVLDVNKRWTLLKNISPKSEGLVNFYAPYDQDKFKPIIDKLKALIKKLSKSVKGL